jgi:hypothetical protein
MEESFVNINSKCLPKFLKLNVFAKVFTLVLNLRVCSGLGYKSKARVKVSKVTNALAYYSRV